MKVKYKDDLEETVNFDELSCGDVFRTMRDPCRARYLKIETFACCGKDYNCVRLSDGRALFLGGKVIKVEGEFVES